MNKQTGTDNYIRNTESFTVEALDAIIAAALLKGRNVVIPGFGYLELRLFPGRRTVLFKAVDPQDLPLYISLDGRDGNVFSILSEAISRPLKEGKVVSMPSLGIFRPLKKEDGSYYVSFTPSFFFRRQLNECIFNEEDIERSRNTEVKEVSTAKIKQELSAPAEQNNNNIGEKVADHIDMQPRSAGEYFNNENTEKESIPPAFSSVEKGTEIATFLSDEVSTGEGNKNRIIWLAACASVVAFLFIGWVFWPKNVQPVQTADSRRESINLVDLARKNYGNPAFWVYIYDSNRDKLSSPVNIPKGVALTIPDLSEYNIDIKDSMEIIRANIHSESILQKYYSSK